MRVVTLLIGLLLINTEAQADAQRLTALLQKVQESQQQHRQLESRREAEFTGTLENWQQKLAAMKARVSLAQTESQRLGQQFDDNEIRLGQLTAELDVASANLGELFGVVRQVAREFSGALESSLVSAQYPGRGEFVATLAERKALPSLAELERLWVLLLQEMTASAHIARFEGAVLSANGVEQRQPVWRVGGFNLIADQHYLIYRPEDRTLEVLDRPIEKAAQRTLAQFDPDQANPQALYFDPSRGPLLSLLSRAPTLQERIEQGGSVGYLILAVLALGLGIALVRFSALLHTSLRIRTQQQADQPLAHNPLGRILSVYQHNRSQDTDLLELKLNEAILGEVPRLERGIAILKILAAIAPMLGLLGTVAGMITTFQSITLFGTSDPKLMAGGISTALVTTVMGLLAALPLLLLHSLLSSRSERLINLLEHQSAGMVAEQAEQAQHRSPHALAG